MIGSGILTATLAFFPPQVADRLEGELQSLVETVYDASATALARHEAWDAVDRIVDELVENAGRLDAEQQRALIYAADFYVNCSSSDRYSLEHIRDVAELGREAASALEAFEDEAFLSLEIGKVHAGSGEHVAAKDAYLRGLAALGDRSGSPRGERLRPVLCNHLMTLYVQLGMPDVAAQWLGRLEESSAELEDDEFRHTIAAARARLAQVSGRSSRAVRITREALAANALQPQHRAHFALIEGLALADQTRAGQTSADEALEALERALAEPSLSATGQVEARLQQLELCLLRGSLAESEAVIRALESTPRNARRGLAGSRLQAYRYRFAELAGHDDHELRKQLRALEHSFDAFLDSWASTPLEKGGVGFLQYRHRRFLLSQLLAAYLHLFPREEAIERGFDAILRASAMGTLARRLEVPAGSFEQLARRAKSDEGFLLWVPGPDGSHLFLLDENGAEHVPVAAENVIRTAADALKRELAVWPVAGNRERATTRARRAAAALADVLIPRTVRERVRAWRKVTLVGTDLLGPGLALAALEVDDWGPLGIAKELTHWPSFPIGLWLERQTSTPPAAGKRRIVAAVGPEPSRHAPETVLAHPIPASPEESRELAKLYTDTSEVVAPNKASLARLVDAGPADVLYLLTHGVHDASRLRPRALILAPSSETDAGTIHCDDIERAWNREDRPSPRIVILAACGAARSAPRRGEDASPHFGGAFLASGSEVVLLSASDLDYGATRTLMKSLHERLSAGASPAASLRAAREELVRDEQYRHPVYYALLEVTGLGHR